MTVNLKLWMGWRPSDDSEEKRPWEQEWQLVNLASEKVQTPLTRNPKQFHKLCGTNCELWRCYLTYKLFSFVSQQWGAEVVQLIIVTRVQAGWPGFNSWWGQWQDFSFHHPVYTTSGAQTASYPRGTTGSYLSGTAARAWSWPLTSVYSWG
jgi:hypothetical protein